MKSKLLADITRCFIGIDVTPENLALNEVACAESVSKILHLIMDFPEGILSTANLFNTLNKSKLFRQTTTPIAGCIVVSPRTSDVNGHTGIFIDNVNIVSNDSRTGKMKQNYTWTTWQKTFVRGRNLKVYLFEII